RPGRCRPSAVLRRRPARRSGGAHPHDRDRGMRHHRGVACDLDGTSTRERKMNESYPLNYSVDYPEEELNRLTTFFRLFMLIPIGIVLATVDHYTFGGWGDQGTGYIGAGGILIFGPLLMILFLGKYPRWWFDGKRELLRYV